MFVEVAVDFTDADRLRTYTYRTVEGVDVQPGDLLWVPFGYRPVQGIALAVSESTETERVRQIESVVDGGPFISENLLEVARWIAEYYRTNIFRACVAMLPPGTNQQLHIWVERTELSERVKDLLAGFSINPDQEKVLEDVPKKGRIRRDRLVRKIGRSNERHLDALVRTGIVAEESIWERPRTSAIFRQHIKIADDIDFDNTIDDYLNRRAHRRAELLRLLFRAESALPRAELSRQFSPNLVKSLIDDGVAEEVPVRVDRDPLANYAVQDSIIHDLTPEQSEAVDAISAAVTNPGLTPESRRFLLFGVTGSGKTEVYLRAVQNCIEQGRRAIIMVPEIAMTPQTLQRFASRFPGQIALQHSGLTIGQRFDQWHQIRNGRYNVIIGSRSSIFAPVESLGLVVIDEEHEWTLKQSDRAPRYHARDVAVKLCDVAGAALVLGSATPDIETYHRANGSRAGSDITMLDLPRRINQVVRQKPRKLIEDSTRAGHAKVQIVDMRVELQSGHREALSRHLLETLRENVERGEKSILFINRRGSASFVQCLSCGTIRNCPNCQTPLTLHRSPRRGSGSRLQCHYCSYSVLASRKCRKCDGNGIARRAAGTEGVEEVVRGFFPNTPIIRWDSDTARNAREHTQLLEEFQSEGNHILIGTQMVAKGLDIPKVSLVGAISADIGLAAPSFRSAEKTFQILSQVTGRAGRADTPGIAIIQTFQPKHFAIAAAAAQDYRRFYDHEIETRRIYRLPPFTSYVRLTYGAYQSNDAEMEARSVRTRMEQHLLEKPDMNVEIAGPSPTYPARQAGRYRWQILLKGEQPAKILDQVQLSPGWTEDIDPLEMS